MDEGRRFLRYVIPGTVFIVEAWFLMWILIFLRTMPWIAVAEVREALPPPAAKGGRA